MRPKEGNKDGERTRGHDLGGAPEDTKFVQLREEETEGCPHCCLQLPHEGGGEGGADFFSLVSSGKTQRS